MYKKKCCITSCKTGQMQNKICITYLELLRQLFLYNWHLTSFRIILNRLFHCSLSIPYVQNAMTHDAFECMRRFIHFSNNRDKHSGGHSKYNPLYKVQWIFDKLMCGIQLAWIPQEQVTIDGGIVKYKGRAIAFIQYNPKKPIKHGIKVFAVSCAYAADLLGFKIYISLENSSDASYNTAAAVVKRLIEGANFNSSWGCTLYTDNWYTSIMLAKTLSTEYGWQFYGTQVATEKKAYSKLDLPFNK